MNSLAPAWSTAPPRKRMQAATTRLAAWLRRLFGICRLAPSFGVCVGRPSAGDRGGEVRPCMVTRPWILAWPVGASATVEEPGVHRWQETRDRAPPAHATSQARAQGRREG